MLMKQEKTMMNNNSPIDQDNQQITGNEPWMRLLAGVLFICGIGLLISRGSSQRQKSPSETTDNTEISEVQEFDETTVLEEKNDSRYTIGDTAHLLGLDVSIEHVKRSKGNGLLAAAEGNEYVGFYIIIDNTSSTDQYISSLLLFDAYTDGVKSNYSTLGLSAFSNPAETLDGRLAPGKRMMGYYVIEVSEAWSEIEIQFLSAWLPTSQLSAAFIINNDDSTFGIDPEE